MSSVFRSLPAADLTRAVEELLLPQLVAALQGRSPGHCMRVTDLDRDVMVTLARELRKAFPAVNVFVLADGEPPPEQREVFVTSTKLVELRNPNPDGTLRSPLCVFLPANLRTSAEDSFGKATFEDFPVGASYKTLVRDLLTRLPSSTQGYVRDFLQSLTDQGWQWAGPVAQVCYLLCALGNGADGETLGAALYELGLVPDFRLFDDPTTAFGRIRKNLDCVKTITDSAQSIRYRVLDLDLVNRGLRRRLAEYLVDTGIEDPVVWAREIVLNKKNWDLAFDKWEFTSEIAPDKVAFTRVESDLPVVPEDAAAEPFVDLVGQQVLAPKDRTQMEVTFEVSPHPRQVQGLDYFTVQIISRDSGPVGVVKKIKVWGPSRTHANVKITKLNRVDFEEGWHVLRVLPWTADGDPIPIEDPEEATGKRPNESEPFYVVPDAEVAEEPAPRTVAKASSLEHARLERQFAAIQQQTSPAGVLVEGVAWVQQSTGRRTTAQELLEVKFGKAGVLQVPVARWLKIIEQRILGCPDRPVSWRMQINLGQPETPTADVSEWPSGASVQSFLAARGAFFAAVRRGEKELVTEGFDFRASKAEVLGYAGAYMDLVRDLSAKVGRESGADQQRAIVALRAVLTVDTVRLVVQDYRGHHREAALLAPTHPLRALWNLGWTELGDVWAKAAAAGTKEHVGPTRDAILHDINAVDVPPLLPISDGRVFSSVDNVHPFWALYAPAAEPDPRGLLGDVCAALGLPEPAVSGSTITGALIASRIERYLVQHPYVRSLSINAFNPGRSTMLADALIALQKQPPCSALRYDLRLFVPDPEAPGVGEALDTLLSGEAGIASEAFSIPSGNHIFPKITIAARSTKDFRDNPDRYRAHMSLLFDVFPPEEISTQRPHREESTTPLHGLIQGFSTRFHDDESGAGWERQPRHGTPIPIEGSEETTDLLGALPALISAATATVAKASPDFAARPVIRLELDADERAMISQVHEVSDWVFTSDRNMGIEFYDHGGRCDRPDYLIDYTPNAVPEQGHRLVITSRSMTELEALLRPVMKEYGLELEEAKAGTILDQLRSLSGRLALKLLSSPTARAEALGLALAKLFLERQGALANQVILPLDTHLDLFRTAKRHAEEIGDEATLRRTDLALFDLDLGRRTITCNLVEVKCYAQNMGLSGYSQLKEKITEQLNQSERTLRTHFDPHLKTLDRPDRLLKTRQLASLLEFYLDRSVRYGLIVPEAAAEARLFLDLLEEGYRLEFSRSALVFDFERKGTEPPEHEVGVEFHRVGSDIIRTLIAEATRGGGGEPEVGPEVEAAEEPGRQPAEAPVPIPRLEAAAFLVAGRTREAAAHWMAERPSQPSDAAPAPTPEGRDEQPLPPEGEEEKVATQAEVPAEQASPTAPLAPAEPVPAASDKHEAGAVTPPPVETQLKAEPGEHSAKTGLAHDIVLGVAANSPQYGLIGEAAGRKVALDLNQTHTISLFGVQGGGKSYTLGTIVEMACVPIPGVNELPKPLATVIFHYSPTLDYKPEFTSMVAANSDAEQIQTLKERYGALPKALKDVVILAPRAKVEERAAEYPGIRVLPIAFAAAELKAPHWKFLMGAVGSESMYLRQVRMIMKKLRGELTLAGLRQGIEDSGLSDYLRDLALLRLNFAEEYIDDHQTLRDVMKPGRLVIVDLRDELIEKDEALGLFVVLLQIFAEATYEGQPFNKLVVFDEAHKYIDSPDLVAGLVEVVREMRHKGTSIMVASQDPPSVPISLIELSTQIILHKFNSPAWLKHIQKANSALDALTPAKLSSLGPGEAYVWSSKATDDAFTHGAVRLRCRPRVTQHGGATKTALEGRREWEDQGSRDDGQPSDLEER